MEPNLVLGSISSIIGVTMPSGVMLELVVNLLVVGCEHYSITYVDAHEKVEVDYSSDLYLLLLVEVNLLAEEVSAVSDLRVVDLLFVTQKGI